jgi:two-component system nitrogen regulation response regulator GlnG
MGDNGGPRILVVEDDERVTSFLKEALEEEHFSVEAFSRAEDALAHVRSGTSYYVALVDILLSGMDGLAFTRTVCSLLPDMFVVVMTGYGTGDLAAQAIRMGAYDYLPKPFDKARVLKVIQQALRDRSERLRNISMVYAPLDSDVLLGESPAMRDIFKVIGKLGSSASNVVIRGEPGTGRMLTARAIHRFSQRNRGPYVAMDCSAYDGEAAGIILFGGEAGDARGGRFGQAAAGTLALSRPDLLPEKLQTRLLGILGEEEGTGDVRIVSILPEGGQETALLPELYYKLRVMEIDIPPLRERKEDIPVFVDYFRRFFNFKLGKSVPYFTEEVMAALMAHGWPGNVRDLRNAVEFAITGSPRQIPGIEDFPPEVRRAAPKPKAGQEKSPCAETIQKLLDEVIAAGRKHPLNAVNSRLKRMVAQYAVETKNGDITDAAKLLGVSRTVLRSLLG